MLFERHCIFFFIKGFDNIDCWESSPEFVLGLVLVAPCPSSTKACDHALDQRDCSLGVPACRGGRAERQEAEEDGEENEEKYAMIKFSYS